MSARWRGVVVGGLLVLLVAGCTSAGEPEPGPTATERSPDVEQLDGVDPAVEELEASIFGADPVGGTEPVATLSGRAVTMGGEWDVHVDVLGVVADPDGTVLQYVLRSPDGEPADGDPYAWGDGRKIWNDTRSIALVDGPAGTRLHPYTARTDADRRSENLCVCSEMRWTVGAGDPYTAVFAPLTPGVTTVTLELPGLEPLTDVPVTWR